MNMLTVPSTGGGTPGSSGVLPIRIGRSGGGLVRMQVNKSTRSIAIADNPDLLRVPPVGNLPGSSFAILNSQGLVQFQWEGEIWAISFDSDATTVDVALDLPGSGEPAEYHELPGRGLL